MRVKECLQFPAALRAARVSSGLSQKVLAGRLALDQSRLCDIERGRRQVIDAPLEARILSSFASSPEMIDRLRLAMKHDRVMVALDQLGMTDQLETFSALVSALFVLDAAEVRGLVAELRLIADGKRRLKVWSAAAARQEGGAP